MKSLNTERIPNPISFWMPQRIISPLFQVPFQGVHVAWLKRGTSALFLTETLLRFWLAYPAVSIICVT